MSAVCAQAGQHLRKKQYTQEEIEGRKRRRNDVTAALGQAADAKLSATLK